MDESERVRVLLVDDDKDFLDICKQNLSSEDPRIHVETATSGEECLAMLDSENFDVLLADYMMEPGMTGLQLLSLLRERGHTLPFIFLTARGNEAVAAEALRLGADDYLIKGITKSGYAKLARAIMDAANRLQGSTEFEPVAPMPHKQPFSASKRYELLQAILEEVPAGILVLGADRRVMAANSKLRSILDLERDAYRAWLEDLLENAREKLGDAGVVIYRMLEDRAPIEHLEFKLETASGRTVRLKVRGGEIRAKDGGCAGFVLVVDDVTHERCTEDSLRITIDELKRRLEGRTEVLEIVMKRLSHDLKSPLVSISGYAELLLEKGDEFDEEEKKRQLESIRRNAHKLSKLIDELISMKE